MSSKKQIFTTGEVADLCGVTLRTVVNWIQRGELSSYKLPGRRGDNRITRKSLNTFMQANGMPAIDDMEDSAPEGSVSERSVPEGSELKTVYDVLVVDDDVPMANAIARVFKRAGLKVLLAHDGFEAGVKFAKHAPKLITLDLQMPKMDGFTALEQLKMQSDVHVIVLSGASPEKLSKAKTLGADAIISKPFQNKDLIAKATSFLNEIPK